MKRILSALLSFVVLTSFDISKVNTSVSAAEITDGIKNNVSRMTPVLKLVTKFSASIALLAAIGGASAVAYYKYKHPTVTLKGEVDKVKVEELLQTVSDMKLENRELTVKFEDAVIKKGALQNIEFNYRVLIAGMCKIEKGACNNTRFKNDFEIRANVITDSSFLGAVFEKSIIVNCMIPKYLFWGAIAIFNRGNKYRLPERPEITCDGTERGCLEAKEYLEEVYFK